MMTTASTLPESVLEKDVGTWDAEVEVRVDPNAPPVVSRGVSRNRLSFGKWLITDFENETGFGGHGIYGFDVAKQKYTGVWVDPMRTALTVMEGTWDAAARTMTMRGSITKPDGSTFAWRETTESIDDDTRVFRSLMPGPDGDDREVLRVTYRRRKD
jgi:hypothetical protein